MRSITRTTRVFTIATALLVVVGGIAGAKPDAQWHYLNPNQLDLTALLPPPPDYGSPQEEIDEQKVAKTVEDRSKSEVRTAESETRRTVFVFAPSVGDDFTAARFPLTAQLFQRAGSDVEKLIDLAKGYWDRPRPTGSQKQHGSYPSGHAAFAACSAILLSAILPEKRDAIFNQARDFAENRIILGLHYPSDIATGWTAGTLAAYAMMQNPNFKRDFSAARNELRQAYEGPQHT